MILLAVNHHYVVEEPPRAPRAIFPTTVAELERELGLLSQAFEFVGCGELLAAVRGEAGLPERACAVTFDDGLRCQYEVALPVLDRLGVPAIFFVPGLPLSEGRALAVHKIHALRERMGDHELLARLGRQRLDVERATAMYAYDAPEAAAVKYLLNIGLDSTERDALLDEVFGDEAVFARELYMSRQQLGELGRRGLLGAHSSLHRPLSKLDDAELEADLRSSATVLARGDGEAAPRAISYPYGTSDAVDERVAAAAGLAGFELGFTMEPALNRTLEQPLLLARIDVNDAPGGRHAKLEIVDGELRLLGGVAPRRARYMSETDG